MGETDRKRPVEEYLNLSLINLNSALMGVVEQIKIQGEQLKIMNDRLEKCNWNFGAISKSLKEISDKK